jgi:putative membrane protein
MAFGFVVEKFALFIKQIGYFLSAQNLPEKHDIPTHQGYSSIFGILLVALGALIGLFAFIKYRRIEKQIAENDYHSSAALATVLTALVVLMGIYVVVYLARSQ